MKLNNYKDQTWLKSTVILKCTKIRHCHNYYDKNLYLKRQLYKKTNNNCTAREGNICYVIRKKLLYVEMCCQSSFFISDSHFHLPLKLT